MTPSGDVDMYTDGACSGNPGPGGYAALLQSRGQERMIVGGDGATTNNRMELMAAIAGLESLKRPASVVLHTDSRYVMDGITRWIGGWKRNGWRTSSKAAVKNVDLWQRLELAVAPHDVRWVWVKGHSGHVGNERVDAAAREAIPLPGQHPNRSGTPE